ncbi:MAG: superoxide dismutase [Gammaproteobacteria bacterium]
MTSFSLPPLAYELNALAPVLSQETLEYHYGKHHQTYVNNLNNLIENHTNLKGLSLEQVIQTSQTGPVFNNAAQVWNHSFYWECLSPKASKPSSELQSALEKAFGNLDNFKTEFNKIAMATFGSGWAWLVKDSADQALKIISTQNAGTPIANPAAGLVPLFTCDVWEHAYYIDYRNARPTYLEKIWEIVNWDFINQKFNQA